MFVFDPDSKELSTVLGQTDDIPYLVNSNCEETFLLYLCSDSEQAMTVWCNRSLDEDSNRRCYMPAIYQSFIKNLWDKINRCKKD